MPHLAIFKPKHIKKEVNIANFFIEKIQNYADILEVSADLFQIRIIECETYIVGKENAENIYVSFSLLEGRSAIKKQRILDALNEDLNTLLNKLDNNKKYYFSIEVKDIIKTSYVKGVIGNEL